MYVSPTTDHRPPRTRVDPTSLGATRFSGRGIVTQRCRHGRGEFSDDGLGRDAALDSRADDVNRRSCLLLAAAATATATLDACGSPGSPAAGSGVAASRTTFRSSVRRGQLETYEVLLPPGTKSASGLPVCLVLHGRGDDHRGAVGVAHLDKALAQVTRQGAPPMALVAMDGGDHTYWHRRADGDDPQRMLLEELLPRLAAAGMRTSRFALFGWSMGGYGALLLAEKVGSARVAFVAVDSPALWLSPGDSAPGAFDDAEDFRRNDVFPRRAQASGHPHPCRLRQV